MIEKLIEQFIKFGLVGVFTTGLNLTIYWVCVTLNMHYLLANAIGFIITVAISYVLNNIITFRKNGVKPEWSFSVLIKVYISYFLTGIMINSALLWLWNDIFGINEMIAPVINLLFTVPVNFFLKQE